MRLFGKLSALRGKVWQAMYKHSVDANIQVVVTDTGPVLQVEVKQGVVAKAKKALETLGAEAEIVKVVAL
jgi:hypothetical protein